MKLSDFPVVEPSPFRQLFVNNTLMRWGERVQTDDSIEAQMRHYEILTFSGGDQLESAIFTSQNRKYVVELALNLDASRSIASMRTRIDHNVAVPGESTPKTERAEDTVEFFIDELNRVLDHAVRVADTVMRRVHEKPKEWTLQELLYEVSQAQIPPMQIRKVRPQQVRDNPTMDIPPLDEPHPAVPLPEKLPHEQETQAETPTPSFSEDDETITPVTQAQTPTPEPEPEHAPAAPPPHEPVSEAPPAPAPVPVVEELLDLEVRVPDFYAKFLKDLAAKYHIDLSTVVQHMLMNMRMAEVREIARLLAPVSDQ